MRLSVVLIAVFAVVAMGQFVDPNAAVPVPGVPPAAAVPEAQQAAQAAAQAPGQLPAAPPVQLPPAAAGPLPLPNNNFGFPAAQVPNPNFDVSVPTAGPITDFGGSVPDPLGGSSPFASSTDSNTLPPFTALNSESTTSPGLAVTKEPGLNLGIDRRIREAEDLLNRMVWQLNRETSWANSVHDIIQNYQYKYTKVLSNIKKHTDSTKKMRELVSALKKARLHEILQADLGKATRELTELASSSSQTSEDDNSYASFKERVALLMNELEKLTSKKVHAVVHSSQEKLKAVGQESVPPPSEDTLKDLIQGDKK